jgi:hypothetical protein
MNLPQQINDLLNLLRAEIALGFEVDRPSDPLGLWWLDLEADGMPLTVSWREAVGFGLFTRDEGDAGFGDRPDEIYREPHKAALRVLQLAARWKTSSSRPPLGLRDVRHLLGETQTALARSLGTDQAGVSRIEGRGDWKISTLKQYVAAMGGVLEVRVRFPSFEAPITSESPGLRQRSRHAA